MQQTLIVYLPPCQALGSQEEKAGTRLHVTGAYILGREVYKGQNPLGGQQVNGEDSLS